MAEIEDELETRGIRVVWVLEEDSDFSAGTADKCRAFVDSRGSSRGLCVGDGQTEPSAGVFDRSPFAEGRGFDIVVERETMEIVFVTTHGTPGGNDNLSADELLDEILGALDET